MSVICRCEPTFYPDPGQPRAPPLNKKVYLVMGGETAHPGGYPSWASADGEYSGTSGATRKKFANWRLLQEAWYASCDAGLHSHSGNPPLRRRAQAHASTSVLSAPVPPRIPDDIPPRGAIIINSRSPSPVSERASPPPYSAPPAPSAGPDAEVYAVRLGTQGEIFNSAAEARARWEFLRRRGAISGFIISPSVDRCVAWINSAPSEAEIYAAERFRWAREEAEDPDDEDEGEESA
ncbi:hypothetical protein B0H16DRAFT_1741366 [Mycena metata]|uniref:Uncharacterized protein n=1 Tax=Mycena metata TaxID=1033252 RepID=A0AAD7MGE7_9AGAR|nr:hypothetical protein B0H16DRAFT_1741366 [Mycena metata]